MVTSLSGARVVDIVRCADRLIVDCRKELVVMVHELPMTYDSIGERSLKLNLGC